MAGISRRVLGDLIEARLTGGVRANVTIFRGEITGTLPLITGTTATDPARRVAPYAVLHTGAGTPIIEPDLANTADELMWPFTTIVAAGYDADCADTYDQVHDLLYRWSPTAPADSGLVFGRILQPEGYDPGPIRRIDVPGIAPRYELPAQWLLPVTR